MNLNLQTTVAYETRSIFPLELLNYWAGEFPKSHTLFLYKECAVRPSFLWGFRNKIKDRLCYFWMG